MSSEGASRTRTLLDRASRRWPTQAVFGLEWRGSSGRWASLIGVFLTDIRPALLILFTESLGVGFAVWIEELLAALLPRGFEFGRGVVPVRPAFPGNGVQVLAEILQR